MVQKKYYWVNGAAQGAMTPQFNREFDGSHRARTYAQGGGQGTAADAITSCKYGTRYSSVAENGNANTGWVTCYSSTVLFSGYIYMN